MKSIPSMFESIAAGASVGDRGCGGDPAECIWTLALPCQMDNWYVYPNMDILMLANTQTVFHLLGGFYT